MSESSESGPPETSDGSTARSPTGGGSDSPASTATVVTWDRRLFPGDEFESVVGRSLTLSLALFALGYVLALAWGIDRFYLDPSTFLGISAYLGTVGVFLELLILGRWTTAYRRVWDATERCIASDQRPQYRTLVATHLDRLYHVRRDRIVDVKLVVLAFLVIEPPFVLAVNGLNPLVPWDFLLTLYNAVLVALGLTGIYLFVLHVHLIRTIGRFDIDTPYTAARDFEPLGRLSVSVSVYWFLGVSVLGVYYWLDFLEGLLTSGDLPAVATSLPYSLTVHFALMAVLVAVGTLIFLGPPWLIHRTITLARRSLVHSLNERRNELLQEWRTDPDTLTDVAEPLDSLESLHQSAERIPTWPYHVPDLVKVGLSALIPVVQLLFPLLF